MLTSEIAGLELFCTWESWLENIQRIFSSRNCQLPNILLQMSSFGGVSLRVQLPRRTSKRSWLYASCSVSSSLVSSPRSSSCKLTSQRLLNRSNYRRTSMWYTKREQAVLTSLWYCMTGVQLMVHFTPPLLTKGYTDIYYR